MIHDRISAFLELACYGFGISLVHLTTIRLDEDTIHRAERLSDVHLWSIDNAKQNQSKIIDQFTPAPPQSLN